MTVSFRVFDRNPEVLLLCWLLDLAPGAPITYSFLKFVVYFFVLLLASANIFMALSMALALNLGTDSGGMMMGGMGGNCPLVENEICPSHIHMFILDCVKAGMP